MIFLKPLMFFLLPIAALIVLYARSQWKKNKAWRLEWGMAEPRLGFLRPWLLGAGALFVIVGLARPVWNPRETSTQAMGQDTVFLVDVSRSMQTQDINGESRLESVKRALLDLGPELSGDRVALVAFAGTNVVKCPLTTDVGFFRQAVQLLDVNSAARGGTLLGDSLREVKEDFLNDSDKRKRLSVWVFTDGGDQESYPVEAAKDLNAYNVSLNVWGVGTLTGGTVPERGVSSSLDEGLLRSVAGAVKDGRYYGAQTPLWSLGGEYRDRHRSESAHAGATTLWSEGAWWLLWPALLCVALEIGIGRRVSLRKKK
jgi:hypothetical protein